MELVSVCMDCGTECGRKSAEGAPGGVSHGLCGSCFEARERAAEARERLLDRAQHAGAIVAMLGLYLGASSPWWLP